MIFDDPKFKEMVELDNQLLAVGKIIGTRMVIKIYQNKA